MRKSLGLKILVWLMIFIGVAVAVCGVIGGYFYRKVSMSNQTESLYRVAITIARNCGKDYLVDSNSRENLKKQLDALAAYTDSTIWLVDRSGNVTIGTGSVTESFSIEDFDITDFGNKYYTTGDFYGNFGEEQLTVFSNITVDFGVSGYVIINKAQSKVYAYGDSFLNITYLAILVLIILLLIMVSLYIIIEYRRVEALSRAAKSVEEGDYTKRLVVKGDDAISDIAKTFNYMATELGTLEDDQKKFISNISHDFRSPLTSIRGYVEAIKDGTIPYEMQDKYLGIILNETERLTKLTSGLIELNQYGGHGKMILDKSVFDINSLIRRTAETFEGKCTAKKITLELVLTGDELLVNADKTKIGQIINNLTDNAVKFSHNDSTITIETLIKYEKVFVVVKDEGIGIPADAVGKIWERFYKTDLSRGKDKTGTGIGLSIVKEIIQAHGENINVVSTEGVGTEFIFTLSMAVEG